MKLSCLAPRVSTALAVISLAITSVDTATAQFTPYGNAYQGRPAYQPHQAYAPQYSTVSQSSATYGRGQQQFMPGPQIARPQQMSQPQYGVQQYAQPQYVAMARQPAINNVPPIQQPTETVPPGPMQMGPQTTPTDYSANGGYENYSANGVSNGAGYACEGYGSYTQGNYSCDSYGSCNTCCAPCGPRRHWFGGIYGLLMERVECSNGPIVYQTTMPGTGHYPTSDEVVMSYGDLDGDVQPGFEVRFGATFACCGGPGGYGGCYDPCSGGAGSSGCGGGCCGTLGWEVGYWMLDEESTSSYVTDTVGGPTFTHTMKRFDRLEHYYDGVWRPLNHFYSYGVPTQDYWTAYGDIAPQLTYVYTRSSFQAQNVEWNLVCLPTISGGSCGTSCCDPCGGGSSYGGGCDSYGGGGGCGHFGGGCGAYCYCGPRWQCSSSFGVRYFRFDDDYLFQADWEMYDYAGGATTGDTGSLAYYNDLNNQLVGFQFGGSGCYHLGCCGRVALHFGANAGIYGNYIEMNQYFNGQVRDMGDLMPYNVMAEDENISFLGELRLGASYQCTCNCRVYGGYRAFGVTGVAVNYNQQPSPTDMPYINCDGSLFLHGIQSGVEFMY
jgi:hypothetical protein